jgi:hypothetical protein
MDVLHLTAVGIAGTNPKRIVLQLSPPVNVSGDVEIAVLSYRFSGAVGGAPSLHSLSLDLAGTSISGSGYNQVIALAETIGAPAGSTIQYTRISSPLRWIPLSIQGLIHRIVISVEVIHGEQPNDPIVSSQESVVELQLRRIL